MEKFKPVETIKKVTIFADNDKSYTGQKSAFILANKLVVQGVAVDVELPPAIDTDFADLLIKRTERVGAQ